MSQNMTISKLEAGIDASNHDSNRYAKLLEGSWIAQFRYGSNPWMARYVYSVMFLLANLLAWAVRDYGPTALTEMNSKIYSYFRFYYFLEILELIRAQMIMINPCIVICL